MKKRQKIWIVVLLTLLAAAGFLCAVWFRREGRRAPQTGNLIANGAFFDDGRRAPTAGRPARG